MILDQDKLRKFIDAFSSISIAAKEFETSIAKLSKALRSAGLQPMKVYANPYQLFICIGCYRRTWHLDSHTINDLDNFCPACYSAHIETNKIKRAWNFAKQLFLV